jgi:hypothetical protein
MYVIFITAGWKLYKNEIWVRRYAKLETIKSLYYLGSVYISNGYEDWHPFIGKHSCPEGQGREKE